MAVRKTNGHWHYDIQVRGVRHRGSIPEALNKAQAERAGARIKLDIFEQKFGDGINQNLAEFVDEVYVPAAKTKRAYVSEDCFIRVIVAFFGQRALKEVSPMLSSLLDERRGGKSFRRRLYAF